MLIYRKFVTINTRKQRSKRSELAFFCKICYLDAFLFRAILERQELASTTWTTNAVRILFLYPWLMPSSYVFIAPIGSSFLSSSGPSFFWFWRHPFSVLFDGAIHLESEPLNLWAATLLIPPKIHNHFTAHFYIPLQHQFSGATLLNLSLLTSDMWAVVIRIFVYHQVVCGKSNQDRLHPMSV